MRTSDNNTVTSLWVLPTDRMYPMHDKGTKPCDCERRVTAVLCEHMRVLGAGSNRVHWRSKLSILQRISALMISCTLLNTAQTRGVQNVWLPAAV